VIFRNKLIFYGEELLAPRSTPKLEDHPLSSVRDCLFNIFAVTPPYLEGVSSIRNLRTRHAVVTRGPQLEGGRGSIWCTVPTYSFTAKLTCSVELNI
jgi:hypothetical protein